MRASEFLDNLCFYGRCLKIVIAEWLGKIGGAR